jgi:hypothetical protein
MAPIKEAPPYIPPASFELVSFDEPPSASHLFKNSNLEGKQIWYITAPASVPISSIQQTSLSSINQSNAILSHKGNNYGFIQDSSEDMRYTKVMVPNSSDEGYHAGKCSLVYGDHLATKFSPPRRKAH